MIRKLILWIVCGSLTTEASARLRELGPGRYECTAGPGRYSHLDVSSFFGNNQSIAARFRFVSADPDPQWSTSAGIVFHLDSGQTATVMVIAPRDDSRVLWVGLKPPGSTNTHWMETVRRGRIVELSATMARGAIFARVGNQRGQINVGDARLASREIMCSSGRFEIELTRNPRPPRRL